MTTGPQRQPYPKTPEEAKGTGWEEVHRVHGSGDTDALFRGAPKTTAPWPSAGKTKSNPRGYDPARVEAAVSSPEKHLRDLDPRHLHSTQPWVTRQGVEYYMGDEYRQTGRTFANMEQAGNRFPVVYTDAQGRNKLLSGHHRATAAVLQGAQLRAIHIEE